MINSCKSVKLYFGAQCNKVISIAYLMSPRAIDFLLDMKCVKDNAAVRLHIARHIYHIKSQLHQNKKQDFVLQGEHCRGNKSIFLLHF